MNVSSIDNPFDNAFREELRNVPNRASLLKCENVTPNCFSFNSHQSDSLLEPLSNGIFNDNTVIESPSAHNKLVGSFVILSGAEYAFTNSIESPKSAIQQALLQKINYQSMKVKSGDRPLSSPVLQNNCGSNNNNNCNESQHDNENVSETRRKNRDAAKRSRQRKKLYIVELEKEKSQYKNKETQLQQSLTDALKTIEILQQTINKYHSKHAEDKSTSTYDN